MYFLQYYLFLLWLFLLYYIFSDHQENLRQNPERIHQGLPLRDGCLPAQEYRTDRAGDNVQGRNFKQVIFLPRICQQIRDETERVPSGPLMGKVSCFA